MLKKLMLLLNCVSLLALNACGEEESVAPNSGLESNEFIADGDETFIFSVEIISDDELADLARYKEINYAMVRESFITEGLNVRFNFNQPIRNFSLINVARSEHNLFVKTGTLYEVGDLNPYRPLVLTHFFSNEKTGFYFDGPGGEGGWFSFEQSSIDSEITLSRFDWSHNRELFVVDEDLEMPDLDEVMAMMPSFNPIIEPEEIILSITRLAQVSSDEEYEDVGMLTVYDEEYGLLVNIDFEQLLSDYDDMYNFSSIHIQDYNYVRQALGDDVDLDDHFGDTLMIQTNVPLREFAVILFGHDKIEDEDGFIFIPIESFGEIEYFMPDEVFVIKSYLGRGTLPWSGITFLDDEDAQRYYAIIQDQSGLFDPYRLIPFENRADELPDDWEPWWEEDEKYEEI